MSTSTLRRPLGTTLFSSPSRADRPGKPPNEQRPVLPTSPSTDRRSQEEQFNPDGVNGQGELAERAASDSKTAHLKAQQTMNSPPLKRSHSAVSDSAGEGGPGEDQENVRQGEADQGSGPSRHEQGTAGFSKVPKLDRGSEDVTMAQRAMSSSPEEREGGNPERAGTGERNYVWQSAAAGSRTGGGSAGGASEEVAREAGLISSPGQRVGLLPFPESGRGPVTPSSQLPPPSLPSPGRHVRGRMMETRLPSLASISQRPSSPPPQLARYHAERSYVSANPAVGGVSGAGRSLAHFHPGHGHSASISHPYASGHQMGPGSTSPLMASASTMQGCPPIHPSLIGIPGSGMGPGNKQQPSFVAKLYSMLEDDATGNMITWGPSGDVFSVANPSEFSRVILPSWFKHANWQSFVRQLNMYGFHKVNHTFGGTPNEEVQIWEFKHPSFRRGAIHLLSEIKRKASRHKRTGSQSQSFSGSIHGTDFDGRRSRSSTPLEMYPSNEPPFHPTVGTHPAAAQAAQQHRYRQYPPAEQDYREPMMSHSRMRSMTDAAMRPPPRSFAQAGGEMVAGGAGPSSSRAAAGEGYQASPAGPGNVPLGPPPPPPPSTSGAGGTPAAGRFAEEELQFGQASAGRISDLSNRVDAIIRHSNYLEEQVRTLSDQLSHMEQHERVVTTHLTRSVNRLTHLCALSERTEQTSADELEAIRRRFLDVSYSEIADLNRILMLEPGTLSPPPGAYSNTAPAGSTSAARPPLSPVPPPLRSSSSMRGGPAPTSGHAALGGKRPTESEERRSGLSSLGMSGSGTFSFPRR